MICACTDTSSADTGSSQMISFGSVITARAIEMRWHCPPENSWGRRPRATSGSMPTASSTSSTFFERETLSPMPQISRPSPTRSPTLRRGFSDEIGSWKIICIRGRILRSASPCSFVSSWPSNSTVPDVGGGSWIDARASVDLPHPDSPTMPRVSPSLMSTLTPDTAFTLRPDLPIGNSTTMSSTRSRVSSAGRRWAVPLPATRPCLRWSG